MTSMPFKEWLFLESRMLGIQPHTLYCRIYRGKHPKPQVARQVGKKTMLVVSTDPRHDHWVKHHELVQAAMDAIRAVYADQSVDSSQTIESLDDLGEMIETLLSQIPE
jgi:hypothetical protein